MVRLISSVLLLSHVLCALPVSNPADATLYQYGVACGPTRADPCVTCFNWSDVLSLRGGFYGDYVFNRKMRVGPNPFESEIHRFEIATNGGMIALNCADWYEVFGVFGATQIDEITNGSSFSNDSTMMLLDFGTHFSWGIGGRMTLCHYNHFYLGVVGQYCRTRSRIDHVTRLASGNILYFNQDNYAPYSNWQIALGLTYPICCYEMEWAPYLSLSYSDATLDTNGFFFVLDGVNYTLHSLKSSSYWSYVIGCSVLMYDAIGLTVEGRFLNENAISIVGEIRY